MTNEKLVEDLKMYRAAYDENFRLTREIDVALHGEDAAQQASLCDLVEPARELARKEDKLREAVDFIRTTIRNNIVVKPGPHTVELPDGSVHGGPVAEYLHSLLPMIADVLDRAAEDV